MTMLKQNQAGVTLIELMIGLLIGLFITGGVISVYIAVSQSSSETLKQAKLNQDMSAIMNVMTNDIRRAGYWVSAGSSLPHENPFMQFKTGTEEDETTALQVRDLATADDFAGHQASGDCILYTYDTTDDANITVESNDRFGFRWNGTDLLEMKTGGSAASGAINNCADGTWQPVNDTQTIQVTALSFSLSGSTCINSSEPDDEDDDGDTVVDNLEEYDCYGVVKLPELGGTYVVDSGEATTEVRQVAITLEAQLTGDPLVKASMTQTVRARNDLVRLH